MSRTLNVSLNPDSIEKAIKSVNQYKQEIIDRNNEFRVVLSRKIELLAQNLFDGSLIDDIIGGSPRPADVTVYTTDDGTTSVVVASGEDAVWAEFGAGIAHNTPAGKSPNPWGENLFLTIGSYGKGHGSRMAWGYYNDEGELVITRGTEATMPMFTAVTAVADEIYSTAKEVFG